MILTSVTHDISPNIDLNYIDLIQKKKIKIVIMCSYYNNYEFSSNVCAILDIRSKKKCSLHIYFLLHNI